jgi:RNA polymerase sigma-70 factor (ECF subfamily)
VQRPRIAPAEHSASTSDDDLVAAALVDAHAFDALYTRYAGPIYRLCFARLGDREAAEDATSTVFLKALSALDDYRPGNVAGWLYRIATNVVADTRRQHARRPTLPLAAAGDPHDDAPSPDDVLLERDRQARLRAVLATLPGDQRVAIELQLAGWDGARIAEALGRSPEAVRMLRYRGVAKLRALLDPDESAGGGR